MKVDMRIGTRILAGYGLALLVVGGIGIIAYRGVTELVDSADWVLHTHKVKEALIELRSSLKDAETGQRGFLLTGEERYLEPYRRALVEIPETLNTLANATANRRPDQARRIDALKPLVRNKLDELQQTTELRKS